VTWSIPFIGAYNTPRLLELSGIGNPAVLSLFNIPTVVDLPTVGENLQEHPYVVSDFVVKEGVFTLGELQFHGNRRVIYWVPIDRLRNDPIYKEAQEKE
jgi:choline dehydrogenase-like flavoprotein